MTTLSLRDLGFVGGLTPAISYDTDAKSYITAVEAADGQTLETTVKNAINAFVVGCKSDGIWTAIKASCILAGARTLAGALVPLVGTAPTNNNFVSADYNRKTGLKGNGLSKFINTNRPNGADPQNNKHVAVWVTNTETINNISRLISAGNTQTGGDTGMSTNNWNTGTPQMYCYIAKDSPSYVLLNCGTSLNFHGLSRSNASNFIYRSNGLNQTATQSSASGQNGNHCLFADLSDQSMYYFSGQIAFYSIGESLALAQLDSRVATLIAALAAAIP